MLSTILSNFSSFNPMVFSIVLAAGAMFFFRRPATVVVAREATRRAPTVRVRRGQ